MEKFCPLIRNLIEAFKILPGVGSKTAIRFAFGLLSSEKSKVKGLKMASLICEALTKLNACQKCRMYTENGICSICRDKSRDNTVICVVENAVDIFAIEDTAYKGFYFVLHRAMSPIDGVGPSDIGLPLLFKRIMQEGISEVILATSSTVEGDVTAQYIFSDKALRNVKCTRLGRGIPVGSELEWMDRLTLESAFNSRVAFCSEVEQ